MVYYPPGLFIRNQSLDRVLLRLIDQAALSHTSLGLCRLSAQEMVAVALGSFDLAAFGEIESLAARDGFSS